MALATRIEGYAIVSADGMLADSTGVMPESLKFDADQRFFADKLARVDAIANGRHSNEQQPNSATRKRLVLTRQIPALAPDPESPKGLLWNPAGASLEKAWEALGLDGGILGIVGGTFVFDLFLDRYTHFFLSHAPGVRLPGGRPVFTNVPNETPEQVLTRHGLVAGKRITLDVENGVTVTAWQRRGSVTAA
ncbi:MAG: dihydrofolate reductase [Pseudolabrys sp.]